MSLHVGFIGLGLMGRPMALRLLRAGYRVTVWNRTNSKANQVAEEGGTVAVSPRELARTTDVVVIIVTGPRDVEAVLAGDDGVLGGVRAGTTIIDMSTIGFVRAQQIAACCAAAGVTFLDAPVTGSVPGAENGTLTVMVGGDSEVFARYRPLLQTFGEPIYVGSQGMGALMKLTQNLITAALVEALAEGLALAEGHGLDMATVMQVLAHTGVHSEFLRMKGEKMVEQEFSPQFSLANMTKDLALVLETARKGKVQLPLAERLLDVYQHGVLAGYGGDDYAVLVRVLRPCRREG
ncbi:MAG: NAD(P)-dependent oxidoreductase [Deltaproteobacteria bacterium]|nr:NAD(P)-dependent oxidoreductase [Deltaproteobacteria bacterium]